jgi:hypothetical protein
MKVAEPAPRNLLSWNARLASRRPSSRVPSVRLTYFRRVRRCRRTRGCSVRVDAAHRPRRRPRAAQPAPAESRGTDPAWIDAQLAAHGTTAHQAVLDVVAEFDVETYLLDAGVTPADLDEIRRRLLEQP